MACQKSRISQRRINHVARFQIHSAPSHTMVVIVGDEPAQFAQLPVQPVEDVIGITQTTDQKAPHDRAPSGGRFDSFLRQKQNASLDLAEMAFVNGRQRRQWLRTLLSPPTVAHLHTKRTTIHAQQNSVRSFVGDGTCASAIGVITAQPFAVIRHRLSQNERTSQQARAGQHFSS